MLARVQDALRAKWSRIAFDTKISCHHNYVAEECHFGEDLLVTRKGAIRSGVGEMGIQVPGGMARKWREYLTYKARRRSRSSLRAW